MDCIHINDSYRISKSLMETKLERYKTEGTPSEQAVLANRSMDSLKREWATHNLCYKLGLWRSRTKDVDLQFPLPWYERLTYNTIGFLSLLIIG